MEERKSKKTLLLTFAAILFGFAVLIGFAVINTANFLSMGQNIGMTLLFYKLENWEIVTVFSVVIFILLSLSFFLFCFGFRLPKKRIQKLTASIGITVISAFLVITVYSRFFIFSHNLNNEKIDLNMPAYYSNNYLEEQGFIHKFFGMEEWYCIGKLDTFTWQINGIAFTDTFKLCLDTTYDLIPWYFGYSVIMSPKVDSNFVATLEENDIKITKGEELEIPAVTTNIHRKYFELDEDMILEREFFMDENGEARATYRVSKKGSEPLFNKLGLEIIFIKYCHFINNLGIEST